MKAFSKKMVEGSSFNPPEKCLERFNQNFENVHHVEWFQKEHTFEATFYRKNSEHTALFNTEGQLLEYHRNLPEEYLPEALKRFCTTKGEIRSALLKNKGNQLEYEVIIAAINGDRVLLVFSDTGEVLTERTL